MKEKAYNLTDDEANVIKDILKVIGDPVNRRVGMQIAEEIKMPIRRFDMLLDSAFTKLGNGRVTIIES
jgi:hypothetical protein